MKHITSVRVEIIEQDEDGTTYRSDLTSPTIDMALEKIGAFDRNRDYKSRELAEDNFVEIES